MQSLILCFLGLVAVFATQGDSSPVRMTATKAMSPPSFLETYHISLSQEKLYLTWLERKGSRAKIMGNWLDLPSRVAGSPKVIREGRRLLVPNLHVGEQGASIGWLAQERLEGRLAFEFRVIELDGELNPATGGEERFFYGRPGFPITPIEYVETPVGLFAVGASVVPDKTRKVLRIYRRSSTRSWVELEGIGRTGRSNREPQLLAKSEQLRLFWLQDAELVFSDSVDGVQWSPPRVVATGRIISPRILWVDSGIWVFWAEYDQTNLNLFAKISDDEGATWSEPVALDSIPGQGFGSWSASQSNGRPVFVYKFRKGRCEQIRAVVLGEEGWRKDRIDRSDVCAQIPLVSVYGGPERVLVSWQENTSENNIRLTANEGEQWWLETVRLDAPQPNREWLAPNLLRQGQDWFFTYFAHGFSKVFRDVNPDPNGELYISAPLAVQN